MSIFQSNSPGQDFNKEIFLPKNKIIHLKAKLNNAPNDPILSDNLNESNYLFHSVFQEVGIGMFIIDKNTRIVKSNKFFLELFGYTPKEITDKTYLDLIPEDRKQEALNAINKLFNLKTDNYQSEQAYINKDNNLLYIKVTATVLKGKDGNAEYVLGTCEDVSILKKEEIIRDIIYKISNAVNYADNLYELIKDIKKNLKSIIDSKHFFIAMHNNEEDSFSIPFVKDNKETFETFPAEKTLAAHVLKNKKSMLLNYKDILALQKDDKIRIVGKLSRQWLGVPLISNNSAIGLLGVQSFDNENAFDNNDLTVLEILSNQITASIQKMRSEDALKIERAYFKELFDNSPEAIAIVNSIGVIKDINNEFSNLFGYTKQESVNNIIEDLLANSDLREEVQNLTSEVAKGNIIKTTSKRKKKDGTLVDLSISGSRTILDKGEIAIFVIFRDITDVIENELKLKEAKEKAEESDKLKTSFLTNMSHEIRTPMNAIVGFSDLLADPNLDHDTRKEFVEQIHANSNELLNLIEDIIDISQIDTGKLKISNTKINVSKLLDDLHAEFEGAKKKENKENVEILLHNPFGDQIVYVNSDETRIKQIINHLLSNALKYTDNGFIEFGFDIDQHEKPIFYVRDTGIGISDEKTQVIFEHFNKIEDKAKLYRGTGIGLTITKKLVNLMGGNIWVESNLGIGSIFYFTLQDKVTLLQLPNGDSPHKYNWAEKKILIAEDEDSNFQVLKAALSRTKADITRVKRGDEAIEICKENDYDIVLMDLKMPVLNGVKATQVIKSFKPYMPIIAQTAYVLKNERDTCMKAGFDEYIPKPIKSNVLLETMHRFLI